MTSLDSIKIPNSVYEALKVPEWHKATLEEYTTLEKNGTWVLTKLPPGKNTVGAINGYSQSNRSQVEV